MKFPDALKHAIMQELKCGPPIYFTRSASDNTESDFINPQMGADRGRPLMILWAFGTVSMLDMWFMSVPKRAPPCLLSFR